MGQNKRTIMADLLTTTLVTTMREYLTSGLSLTAALMDILSLSKEAVYRRLRGEVPFSFQEVTKISRRFGFSLDTIIEQTNHPDIQRWAIVDTKSLFSSDNYIEEGLGLIRFLSNTLTEMSTHKDAAFRSATNTLPFRFLTLYKNLSQFRYYQWIYLTQSVKADFKFSDVIMFEEYYSAEKSMINLYNTIPEITLVIDRSIFNTTVNDIIYFYNQRLITQKELQEIRAELLALISYMEDTAATGVAPDTQQKITMLLSDVSIGATYVHMEYGSVQCSLSNMYGVDYMVFTNPIVCHKHKH